MVEDTRIYQVHFSPVETDKDLDYTLLEVFGDPSRDWGKLALNAVEPTPLDPFWVIGHPMGEAQRISREKCAAADPAISGDTLRHTCDTLPGNSGSPVIDASSRSVVALHHAGSNRNAVNYAIPIDRIIARSPILTALTTPELEPEPKPQVSSEALTALEQRIATLTAELAEVRDDASATKAEADAQVVALNAALAQTQADLAVALDEAQDDTGLQAETKRLQDRVTALQSETEELEALRKKNSELETQLETFRNMPGTELYAQRLKRLRNYTTRRAWQIYVASFGTDGLSDPDMVRAASLIEAINGFGIERGQAFEEMLGLTEAQRKRIQSELAKAGFEPGPADGVFGGGTRKAIADWNRANTKSYHAYVNAAMMEAFNLRWTLSSPLEFTSSRVTISQLAEHLALLGEDTDIVEKIDCVTRHKSHMSIPATIYAKWNGRTYIALRSRLVPQDADKVATECGGYLVSIQSRQENRFVAEMVSYDSGLFGIGYDKRTNTNFKDGPLIGLFQSPSGAEPRGGWGWTNGEPLRFTAWLPGQPNEFEKTGNKDFTKLVSYIRGPKRVMETVLADGWADTDAKWSKGFIIEWDD